ncbi:sodium:solute symporter family protein [Fodinibius halophilus]|uniref:Sodium:solute symporter family protein n=1 Tax=Fodinibius halophilus TaxID=1736908 RepID=A0A6M1SZC9_9BACT|nr:sodium:solute symporter family protein [Fodinibius halophilus]NGP88626.1 sodium:solute symporter family protein [Fodinibius halophilus]
MAELEFTLFDWGIILSYFGFLVYLTWQKDWQTDDEESFLLSGRKMSLAAFVATLVSTWYGGILGVGEFSYQSGLSTWLILGFPFYVFSALFAWLLAGKIRMNKALSLPEAVGNFYGDKAGLFSAIPIFILVSPAPYILMLGLIFQYLTGGTGHFLWYASAVALFSVAYVAFGGFNAVVHTDMLQITLMFGGFVCLIIFAGIEFGGFGQLWETIPANYQDITGGHDWQYILVWFFIALWTFVDPSFHQRAAAAESPKTARKGIFISILLWSVFDFLTIFSGIYGFAILGGDLAEPIMVYPYLANEILPIGLKGLFFVALLATIMSTLDSYLFLSGQTLGRDLLVKIFPNVKNNTLTRISTLVAALIGIILIIIYPSVIDLWYVIGSVMIPGLLIPVLGVYLKLFSLKKGWVLPVMIGSIAVSLGWLILGTVTSEGTYNYTYFGIEPFYPGLGVSIILWIMGRTKNGELLEETEFIKE